MATVLTKQDNQILEVDHNNGGVLTKSEALVSEGLALGVPVEEKRFWWQRVRNYDPDAVATLVCELSRILVRIDILLT